MDKTISTMTARIRALRKQDKVRLFSKLTFIAATGLMISGLINTWQASSTVLIFPLYRVASAVATELFWASCGLVPVMLIITGFFTFENLVDKDHYPERYHVELLLMILALMFFLFTLMQFMFSDSLDWLDRQRLGNRVYELAALRQYDALGYEPFVLYDCRDGDATCSRIQRTDSGYFIGSNANLLVDQQANTISIVVDNETIYTHHPQ